MDERGEGDPAREHARMSRQTRNIPLKLQVLGMQQTPFPADPPAIAHEARIHRLTHGLAPEEDGLDREEFGVRSEIDL